MLLAHQIISDLLVQIFFDFTLILGLVNKMCFPAKQFFYIATVKSAEKCASDVSSLMKGVFLVLSAYKKKITLRFNSLTLNISERLISLIKNVYVDYSKYKCIVKNKILVNENDDNIYDFNKCSTNDSLIYLNILW